MVCEGPQKNKFYFYGGLDNVINLTIKNDFFEFDCNTDTFSRIDLQNAPNCAFGSLNFFCGKFYLSPGKFLFIFIYFLFFI